MSRHRLLAAGDFCCQKVPQRFFKKYTGWNRETKIKKEKLDKYGSNRRVQKTGQKLWVEIDGLK